MSLPDRAVTLPPDPRNVVIASPVEVTVVSLARRDYSVAAPHLLSESFGRRFTGFFRECRRRMRVMKVAFESAEHLPT
jgi:hypothetical protein